MGERNKTTDETNGVGKSTMIDSINYLLGSSCPVELKKSNAIKKSKIILVLEVQNEDNILFLARNFSNNEKGYILEDNELNFNLDTWKEFEDEEYKSYINDEIICLKKNEPSFASLKEYIIRDERKGFNDISLPNRSGEDISKIFCYLFDLPLDFENKINLIKSDWIKLQEKIKFIESMKNEIVELKTRQKSLKNDLREIDKKIKTLDIVESMDDFVRKYKQYRKEYSDLQNEIYELEFIKKQYEKNIENLIEKVEQIKKFNDVEQFYKQLIDYFPNKISKSKDEVQDFYEFMVENRGAYFTLRIKETIMEIKELKKKLQNTKFKLEIYSKSFKKSDIINDINAINSEKDIIYKELNQVEGKINFYEQKNKINSDIAKIKQEVMRELLVYQERFELYKETMDEINDIFNSLVNETYEEQGLLEFEMNVKTGLKNNTGRILVTCKIDDEGSHGRNYMKVNMFDLTWFINRLTYNLNNIGFLIHDGSYSKPDKNPKGRLLKYVDEGLEGLEKGQYIVTLNIDELNDQDILYFDKKKKIIAKFKRGNNHQDRFLGIKINNKIISN
ncbi:hypothetical protein bcere0020_22660 [Bacillus cereus Rock3-29]|nr:hypothetical protein bcere0020_22660 [Bacillus cereus Rock3-29]